MINFAIVLLVLALLANIFINKTITLETVLIFCALVAVGVMGVGWNSGMVNVTKAVTLVLIVIQIIVVAAAIDGHH